MPVVNCPAPDCDYRTPDGNFVAAVELLKVHAAIAHPPGSVATTKPEKPRKPQLEMTAESIRRKLLEFVQSPVDSL